jgi:diguanylate cyclase (GGDEF)-like protein
MTIEASEAVHLRRASRARFITIALLGSYTLTLVAGIVFWQVPATRALLSGAVLFTASLIAALLAFVAWRSLARPANRVWLYIALAAALATMAHLVAAWWQGLSGSSALHFLWLASYGLLFASVAEAVYQDEHGSRTSFSLDIALMLTAATLVIVRWTPGAEAAARIAETNGTLLLIVFAPAIALAVLLLGAVLVTGPRQTYSWRVLAGLAGMIGAIAVSVLPQIAAGASCCHAGEWTTLAAIAVWVFAALASSAAWVDGERLMPAPTQERLRQFVAPTVAIVLATISFEVALNPLEPRVAVALGVLGALVAVRLSQLLNATRQQLAERRELAQTRALVEVTRALAGKNELDTTLQVVTQVAARVLNARAAVIELLNADGSMLVLRAAEGLPEHTIGMTFPVDASFTGWVVVHGEPRVTTQSTRDPYMTAASLQLIGDAPVAAMPLRYGDHLLGVLSCVGNRPFDAADVDLLRAFADQAALALEDARLFDQVRMLSVTDPLTGLANRRQLDRELKREFAAAQRGRRLIAAMFDLDDFKAHNDTYGHVAGDEILRRFGEALRVTTRTMNLAARYGGDEFCVLLADTNVEGTEIFTSRVKERFEQTMKEAGAAPVHVSVGIAEYTPDMKTPEQLIEAADRALYVSKVAADVNP